MRAPKTPPKFGGASYYTQDLSMSAPEPSAFALMIPGIYRGLLTKGQWQDMLGQGPLLCEKLKITGNATIAEFVAASKFKQLAIEILNDNTHPAVGALADHLMLECARHIDMKPYSTSYSGHNAAAAKQACQIVSFHPIEFIKEI